MSSFPVKSVSKTLFIAKPAAARFFQDDVGNGSYLLEAKEIMLIQEDSPLSLRPYSDTVSPLHH